MKRMHVHISVEDLSKSINFYNHLFGAQPTVHKPDYAKWMLDDPRVNFAISQRGELAGLNHLGIQVDNDRELLALKSQLEAADLSILSESGTCCYAKSDKNWVQDPSGIAWETYHTMDNSPTFSNKVGDANEPTCCVPVQEKVSFMSRKSLTE